MAAPSTPNNNVLVIIIVLLLVIGGYVAYSKGLFKEQHDVEIKLPGGKEVTADVKE